MTYGHFLNRPELYSPEVRKNTVYYFDEFHEQSDELKVAYSKVANEHCAQPLGKVIFLSATPAPVPWASTTHFDAPLKQRFKKRLYIRDFAASKIVTQYLWAQEQFPEHSLPQNTIIRVNYIHEVTMVIQGLMEFNIPCQEVSRRTRGQPIDKTKLLVCTQIIDAGINLPARRLLIETGMEHKSIRGQAFYEPSSSITAQQVLGRVGRFQNDDIVIRPPHAGTGRPSEPYSSPEMFTYDIVADAHNVQQLVAPKNKSDLFYSGQGRDNFIHVTAREIGYNKSRANNVLLLLAIEQTITDLTTLERDYNLCLKAAKKYRDNMFVEVPEALEHIYLRLPRMELDYTWAYTEANKHRHKTNHVLYSIMYNPGTKLAPRRNPEAVPYIVQGKGEFAKLQQTQWELISPGETVYFHVRALALKEGQWIERESNQLERVVPQVQHLKKTMKEELIAKIKTQTEHAISIQPERESELKQQQTQALNAVKRTFGTAKTKIEYRGTITDTTELLAPIPAAVVVQAINCPVCTRHRPHNHDSSTESLDAFRKTFIAHHDPRDNSSFITAIRS
jgi:hypothetical protein